MTEVYKQLYSNMEQRLTSEIKLCVSFQNNFNNQIYKLTFAFNRGKVNVLERISNSKGSY